MPRTSAAARLDPEVRLEHPVKHLVAVSTAVRVRVREGLAARGHDLSASTSQIVPNLPGEGMRMSELAGLLGLSLQRTGQLVQQLEDDGYVQRVPDAEDRRARRIVYTRRGRKLLRDIELLKRELRDELESILGPDGCEAFVRDLARVDVALNGAGSAVVPVVAGAERD